MENNQQKIPSDVLVYIFKYFGISVDNILFYYYKKEIPV